ncbi:unnamed protein product [Spirodela intermedia]|uniref:Uncharacterized protein n=1 Tax=Spirodela intermedia TaxID=51605 RepID=A0A7I8K6C9_SPIIN|nr:unnamed protein product [Spirodela intermedia]
MGAPAMSLSLAVVINAEEMAAGLQCGYLCLMSAAMPDTCGVAMLVPDWIAKLCPVHGGSKISPCEGGRRGKGLGLYS